MDEKDARKEVTKILKAMGYKVKSVDEGKTGVVITVTPDAKHPHRMN
ncbi:hypothetical protein JXM67_09015 [candidate division WOR-3 bacterium]|nr:hypothetical protein [candidate division WOR-3 bacterium]